MSAEAAKVRVTNDGIDAAIKELEKLKAQISGVGNASVQTSQKSGQAWKGVSGFIKEVGANVERMVKQFADAAAPMKGIDFTKAREQYRSLDESVTRLSLRSGANATAISQAVTKTSKAYGIEKEELVAVGDRYERLTKDADGVAEAIEAVGEISNRTGMAAGEAVEYFVSLRNGMNTTAAGARETADQIRNIATVTKTAGGERALLEMLSSMEPLLEQIGAKSSAARYALLSLATAAGKGMTREQAAAQVPAMIAGLNSLDPIAVRRTVGYNAFDPVTGQAKDPLKLATDLRRVLFKRYKDPEIRALNAQKFGPVGRMLLNFDPEAAAQQVELSQQLEGSGALAVPDGPLSESERARLQRDANAKFYGRGLSTTNAGQRNVVDAERRDVEDRAGQVIQEQKDRVDAVYKGRRDLQIAVEQGSSLFGERAQGAIQLGTMAKANYDAQRAPGEKLQMEQTRVLQAIERHLSDMNASDKQRKNTPPPPPTNPSESVSRDRQQARRN